MDVFVIIQRPNGLRFINCNGTRSLCKVQVFLGPIIHDQKQTILCGLFFRSYKSPQGRWVVCLRKNCEQRGRKDKFEKDAGCMGVLKFTIQGKIEYLLQLETKSNPMYLWVTSKMVETVIHPNVLKDFEDRCLNTTRRKTVLVFCVYPSGGHLWKSFRQSDYRFSRFKDKNSTKS